MERITVTVPTTIDAGAWLGKYLEGDDGDGDLARAMLQSFAEVLMSAQASAVVGAAYGERTEERANFRNGYRHCGPRPRGSDERAAGSGSPDRCSSRATASAKRTGQTQPGVGRHAR